ncbi:hypothetical protein MACH17_20810 [Phaeobacter inhibens]|uniref:hypothetical protein n=1 Tax=Phaeobacter inhibens TaxID=221822 RepID=UPI00275D6E41|nr:hypothetical protein [Phaeobacter inhibens]GLO70564.1 hypothetical protein MACH17_20810 [Phaeobacter inhibens]
MRGHYIAMHQEDPARVEKEIGGLPILGASGATFDPPEVEGKISLNSEQSQTARLLGISPEDYAATLEAEHKSKGHI